MDPDEFIKEVSNSEVLTTDEAFNLILQMKGLTPRRQMSFSSAERSGTWKEEFFKDLSVVPQQYGSTVVVSNSCYHTITPARLMGQQVPVQQVQTSQQVQIPFQITCCKKDTVLIKSIFIINGNNCNISNVSLQSVAGTISTLEKRFHLGHQLHGVVFDPAIVIRKEVTATVLMQVSGNRPTLLQGKRSSTIGDPRKGSYSVQQCGTNFSPQLVFGSTTHSQDQYQFPDDVCITMQKIPWHFVVGLKYKVK